MFKNLHKDFSNGGVAYHGLTFQQPEKNPKISRKCVWKQLVENTEEQPKKQKWEEIRHLEGTALGKIGIVRVFCWVK